MKVKSLFFVSFAILTLFTGCSTTPKVVQTVPIHTVAPTTAEPSPYRFSQEPVKRVIADEGREYRAHIRETQKMQLAHERRLSAIEQAGEEANLATEKGVVILHSSPPVQAPVSYQYQQPIGGAVYQPRVYGGSGWNGFGSVSGTDSWTGISGTAATWGTQSGSGKLFRWLTQSQSSPGLRHTGGVGGTVTTTHSIGGFVGGAGQFNSGFAIQGIRK